MSYEVITPPTTTPIDLAFIKDYLKVDFNDEDAIIESMINAAVSFVEKYTGRLMMQRTIKQRFDRFPIVGDVCPFLELQGVPVINVVEINYLDSDDNLIVWDNTKYKIACTNEITSIHLRNGESYPTTLNEVEAVCVEYTAGYATADEVPGAMIQAMLLLIAHMYECRADSIKKMPSRAEWLLTPCKTFA